MKPLRDGPPPNDERDRALRALVDEVRPVLDAEADAAAVRVRAALEPRLGAPRVPLWRNPWVLGAAAVGAALALTALLAARRSPMQQPSGSMQAVPAPPGIVVKAERSRSPLVPDERPAATAEAAAQVAAAPAAAPALVGSTPRSKAAITRREPRSAPDPAESARARPDTLEAVVVLDAVGALRDTRDPARASLLLDYYLRRHPKGPLAEEALALSIEAALARGDGSAGRLARRYLAAYPDGRYRHTARSALGDPSDSIESLVP